MNPKIKRFAPIGLYVALAAAVASAVFYIIFRSFNLPLQISLSLIVLGIAAFAIMDPQRLKAALTGRQARYGSNALVMSIAFIGILVVINYLVYQNDHRWDLTEDKSHTLTPETINTLSSLPDKVVAKAFFTSSYPTTDTRNLLDSFKYNSKGKFDYTFIDPVADPLAAQEASVTRDGTIVLTMGTLSEPVTYSSEQDLTSALVRLINPNKRVVYFLTGHGEIELSASADISFSKVQSTLETKNYTVNTLNLISTPKIPDDALAIIIAGSQEPLTAPEVTLISDYLANRQGSLIVLSEPRPLTNFGSAKDPLADYLANTWGIVLGENVIVDPNVNPPLVAIANSYGDHPITQKLMGTAAFFPTARRVSPSKTVPTDVSQTVLVLTASNAWGETDYESLKSSVTPDSSKDYLGPVPLAIAASNSTSNSRVVVVGDSDFADDQYFDQLASGDFLINSIDWAAQQENLLNLTPKSSVTRYMIPPTQTAMGLIFFSSVIAAPFLVIVLGIFTWVQRRRRG